VPVNVNVLLAVSVFPSAIVKVDPVAGVVNVTLLMLVADATPKVGVVSVGLDANTNAPLPVSSDITPANSDDVVAAKADSLSCKSAIVPVVVGNVSVGVPAAEGAVIIAVPELAPFTRILPLMAMPFLTTKSLSFATIHSPQLAC
jgi:hypothetical protein